MGAVPSTPVSPPITEHNIPDQTGKVHLITGGTSGIGLELARILYAANAKVYILARSASKARSVIASSQSTYTSSKGSLHILGADFNDLSTIKAAANEFLKKERRLDVLFNNAGIMIPPVGTVTKQGYEAQLGVNVLAPFLFTKLLGPVLGRGSRVVWVSSSAARNFSPDGGVVMTKLGQKENWSQWQWYGISKAASILLSAEMAQRMEAEGLISVSMDPGNLATDLYVNMPKWQHCIAKLAALKPPVFGAYTELYAGLSQQVKSGDWVVPWGKVDLPREDIANSCKPKADGGSGLSQEFWNWCEQEVRAFA